MVKQKDVAELVEEIRHSQKACPFYRGHVDQTEEGVGPEVLVRERSNKRDGKVQPTSPVT